MHFMTEAYPNCINGMDHVMQHVLCMPKRGLIMQPDGIWDGGKEYEFQIDGILIQEMQQNQTLANDVEAYKCF